MTKDFRYRPPLFFIFIGLGGLYVSFIFLKTFAYGEIGFQLMSIFYGLACFVLGTVFTIKFASKLKSGGLKIVSTRPNTSLHKGK
jgi:hypothetical protein